MARLSAYAIRRWKIDNCFVREGKLKPRINIAVAFSLAIGIAYAGWMTYHQWQWYLGWPSLPYAQGFKEYGWPVTYLAVSSSRDMPEAEWRWIIRNLCINSGLCLVLSASVSLVAGRVLHSLFTSGSRLKFSLSTLFLATFSVGMTFALWRCLFLLPMLGVDHWGLNLAELEISSALRCLVSAGLFCLTSVVTLAMFSLGAVLRRRSGPATSPSCCHPSARAH